MLAPVIRPEPAQVTTLAQTVAVTAKPRVEQRSIRHRFNEESVLQAADALDVLFPPGRTRTAARAFIQWLRAQGGQASRNAVSDFADRLQDGSALADNNPIRYSRRNFYMTVLKLLVELGFVQRNVPAWDDSAQRTSYVYRRNIFDIPQKPPSVGFWRLAFYICRKWNDFWA